MSFFWLSIHVDFQSYSVYLFCAIQDEKGEGSDTDMAFVLFLLVSTI